jgi:hypothetical protein
MHIKIGFEEKPTTLAGLAQEKWFFSAKLCCTR